MLSIRLRHVDDEITKLIKQYSNKYEKIVKLMQQIIL